LAVNSAIKRWLSNQAFKNPAFGSPSIFVVPPNFNELLEVNLIIEYLGGLFNFSLQNLSFIPVSTNFDDIYHQLLFYVRGALGKRLTAFRNECLKS
jgi:hypothetical protein